MGLLDDAIREHLELKRLNGADPGIVAREEHDALGPVPRENKDRDKEGNNDTRGPDDAGDSIASSDDHLQELGSSSAGQETVEINMDAELSDEPVEQALRSGQATPVTRGQTMDEESLEWEVPGDHAVSDNTSGTETETDAGDQVEDVLEETPDFLRETPEQERLWFEQRPPRDFDFNE